MYKDDTPNEDKMTIESMSPLDYYNSDVGWTAVLILGVVLSSLGMVHQWVKMTPRARAALRVVVRHKIRRFRKRILRWFCR